MVSRGDANIAYISERVALRLLDISRLFGSFTVSDSYLRERRALTQYIFKCTMMTFIEQSWNMKTFLELNAKLYNILRLLVENMIVYRIPDSLDQLSLYLLLNCRGLFQPTERGHCMGSLHRHENNYNHSSSVSSLYLYICAYIVLRAR